LRLLLDTHAFWWAIHDSPQLPGGARARIADPRNEVWCSDATAWEIAIKCSLGRMAVPGPVDAWFARHLAASGIQRRPIEIAAIGRVRDLPWHHRDPFDRLLASTALCADLVLLSVDPCFDSYGVNRTWD
jgi:PIN domain nuclease of toxin-antitoxin system